MDARGECNLWLSGNYKLVLKTDADVTVWTVDEVRDLTSSQTLTNMTLAGTLTVTSTAVTWSGNPTHSGNHTWTGNQVFNGNVTIGDSAADTMTVTPNAITWSNNPTHSGNHTFSGTTTFTGASTFSANPAGKILSGTYTPSLTVFAATNVAASTSGVCRYVRVGDIVTVSGQIFVDPTTTLLTTQISISLPIASNFSDTSQCSGTAVGGDNTLINAAKIASSAASDCAVMTWYTTATITNIDWYFVFQYQVI
jgi:hypothetical protein